MLTSNLRYYSNQFQIFDHYQLLSIRLCVAVLFNKCIKNGTFSEQAKHARSVCLAKDEVHLSEIKLQSISLLQNIGKQPVRIVYV
jgi:hypothetical protein